ncbi:MAG: PAS domain S-box protein [Smithellaceae bacterium]
MLEIDRRVSGERRWPLIARLSSEERYRILFETSPDAIIVLDAQTGKITDVNPLLTIMFGCDEEEILGKKLDDLVMFEGSRGGRSPFEEVQVKKNIRYEDLPLQTNDGRKIHVDLISRACQIRDKKMIQCNIRDMTRRSREEDERMALIAKLREALTSVRTLSGLLPICASCKKIRDDAGYWRKLEQYISDHSDVKFTHGVCPECEKAMYASQTVGSADRNKTGLSRAKNEERRRT